jgi:hypothetical protein
MLVISVVSLVACLAVATRLPGLVRHDRPEDEPLPIA